MAETYDNLPGLDPVSFRGAMRRLLGGVAIVTTRQAEHDYGIVITAVMSLSMAPPALVIALNANASVTGPLLERGVFCINLLSEAQQEVCSRFSATPVDQRFSVCDWDRSREGLPYLPDAQAVVICDVGPVVAFGTHMLITGEVREVRLNGNVSPLAYVDGGYVGARPLPAILAN